MAQRLESCPHCAFIGADVWREERRPGIRVLYLICRSCNLDWMTIEDITDAANLREARP